MSWLEKFCLPLRLLLLRDQIEREIDDELRFHIEMRTQDNIKAGMTPEDARTDALQRFGNFERIKDTCRKIRGGGFMETLLRNLPSAIRKVIKNPAYTIIAMLALALGIVANTFIYSGVNALLHRPLPFKDAHELVMVSEVDLKEGRRGMSPAHFLAWRDQSQAFAQMAAFGTALMNLTGRGKMEQVGAARLTNSLLPLLGVGAVLGRSFLSKDYEPAAESVLLLSHSFWQHHFAGDPAAIGRTLTLDGENYKIVGIMPRDFRLWSAMICDVWLPLRFNAGQETALETPSLTILARFKPRVTLQQAQAEMDSMVHRLKQDHSRMNSGRSLKVYSLREVPQQGFPEIFSTIYWLLGAVGFALLIACANLANLMLARTRAAH